MREFNVLEGYPEPKKPRVAKEGLRTILHRIVASYRGKDLYDGDRNYGYGGFHYDGRWLPIAKKMCWEYKIDAQSAVLQVGCDKGFLLNDFLQIHPNMKVRGTEISEYPIEQAMESVKSNIEKAPFTKLPFDENEFDLVLALGAVYTLNLGDVIQCLKEIQRVSKGKSFITLGSYTDEESFKLFRNWTLLGTTILHEKEWVEVLKHIGYIGDYKFTGSKSLNLVGE